MNDRLSQVGQPPALSAIENPTAAAGYRPVQMPMPAPESIVREPNSLWRTGSRAFFKDQRARQIGDILTVRVRVQDRANIDNSTRRSRPMPRTWASPMALALPNRSTRCCRGRSGKAGGATSSSSSQGAGSVRRNEQISRPMSPLSSPRCCPTAIW